MKLLCLHCYGTCGSILEQQLAGVRAALGNHHEYVYLDGGLDVISPVGPSEAAGKSFAYYDNWKAGQIREAHELLAETIEEEAPFDGVIAYSQGASLVISFIIQRQIDEPLQQPPFRFGIFFTPGFILSPDPNYKWSEISSFLDKLDGSGLDRFQQALDPSTLRVSISPESFPGLDKLSVREQELCLALWRNVEAMVQTQKVFRAGEKPTEIITKEDFPRFFHPVYTAQRIPFPTVHITGSKEDRAILQLASVAKELCDPERTVSIINQGGHEITTQKETVQAIVRAIEKADFEGRILGF